jgi:hypothetical protein
MPGILVRKLLHARGFVEPDLKENMQRSENFSFFIYSS